MILADFLKALAQMADPRFRRVLALGIGITVLLLVLAYALVLGLISVTVPEELTIPGVGPVTWVGDLLGFGSLLLMLVLSVFLMVPVASAVTSLFLDDVAQAVEDAHYPHLPTLPRTRFWDGLRDTVNFLGVLIAANVAAFLLYVFVPFLSLFIFFAMNGFLLGREYFQLAASRRIGRPAAIEMRKAHATQVWIAGCLMALPLSIPLVNLLIPILGAATFTHLFHRLNGTAATSGQGNPSREW